MKLEFPNLIKNNIHYFDYGATSFMPQSVMDKWCEINSDIGVFVGRGSSVLTKKAEKEFALYREREMRELQSDFYLMMKSLPNSCEF